MLLEYPFFQPRFILIQRKIPVLRLLLDQGTAAKCGVGIDQFVRRQGTAAFLALVSVGFLIAAFRACPYDIAVGEESLCFLVVILFAFLFYEFAFIIQFPEEFRSCGPVHVRRCP